MAAWPNCSTTPRSPPPSTDLPGWDRDGDALVRTAELPTLPGRDQAWWTGWREIAEERDHHPDIDIRWRTLTFRCSTHSAGGITGSSTWSWRGAISEQVAAAGG